VSGGGLKITKWNPQVIEAAVRRKQIQYMAKVGALVQGAIKRKLNVGNRSGKSPAPEGQPPRKVSGDLYGSIYYQVMEAQSQVVVVVGSRDPAALRLELGFVGRDSEGRTIDQGPRPFIRPALTESLPQIGRILRGQG
jgi:hypothetical protein